MSIDPKRTPQEYEMLTGGGAESAEIGRRGMDRRQLLRRAVGAHDRVGRDAQAILAR